MGETGDLKSTRSMSFALRVDSLRSEIGDTDSCRWIPDFFATLAFAGIFFIISDPVLDLDAAIIGSLTDADVDTWNSEIGIADFIAALGDIPIFGRFGVCSSSESLMTRSRFRCLDRMIGGEVGSELAMSTMI